jgi:hypothetical protein
MNAKPVHFLLVSGLLGLVVGCEPAGPQDVTLTAPPGAVSPQSSDAAKVRRLTYSIAQSDAALAHFVTELGAQGFTRCENAKALPWAPYVLERNGKRTNTLRLQELMFRPAPPRVASIELVRQPDDTLVTVEVEQELTGEVVENKRYRFCSVVGK